MNLLKNLRTDRRALWWSPVFALALFLLLRADLAQLRWVSDLSAQGSPPPARDAYSPTGYALGQRHFIGKHERGETYRWIAATQELMDTGFLGARIYDGDTIPSGRPQLLPKLYAAWLTAVAWGIHGFTGAPLPIAVEQAALWEPLLSHLLMLVGSSVFMVRRFGWASGAASALAFALLPSIAGQFLPGALTARTWAMFLAAYAIARGFTANQEDDRRDPAFGLGAALATSAALWLDPAWGFPAVLATAASGFVRRPATASAPFLRWSLIGAGLTFAAWLVDRTPWSLAAGELRYVHPLYALAWLGLGFALEGVHRLRAKNPGRKRTFLLLLVAAVLLSALGYAQVRNDFLGWLYPSVWMRRITSLDESKAFATAFDWIAQASFVEIALLTAPIVGASAALALGWRRRSSSAEITRRQLISATVAFAGVLLLAFFRVRWGVVATLLAWPLVAGIVRDAPVYRRIAATAAGLFLLTLALWSRSLPATLARPGVDTEPSAADVEALLYRHFSHWLASHTPGEKIAALAPPELSDSIVFHGGGHVLMSTAWESYPGQLAARRILSSLESTEAEAVLQGHEITHLILPSWDKVLPLFVQKPLEPGRDTLFDRLDRWTYPGYLRPIPYRLPPAPVYVGQKLAVFKVTPLQDEPLMLSRLAEYFVEMERPEPAAMVARVLMKAYRDDPNAAIARAFVGADARQTTDFERELARLARDVRDGRTPPLWDRRVQRAIALALGRQRELARTEIEACLDTATAADLLELTPVQAYRLSTLAHAYGLRFADETLTSLLAALGAEYRPAEPKGDSR